MLGLILQRRVMLASAVLLLSAFQTRPTRPSTVVPMQGRGYAKIGLPAEPCEMLKLADTARLCAGVTAHYGNDAGGRARWLKGLEDSWRPWGAPIPRKGKEVGKDPVIQLAAIYDVDMVTLQLLNFEKKKENEREVAVARLAVANSGGKTDARFGIGGDPTFETVHYLVISNYAPADGADSKFPKSKPIATWTIYGIKQTNGGSVAEARASGSFKFCNAIHRSRRVVGLHFAGCETDATLMSVQRRYSAMPTSKIQSLQEFLAQHVLAAPRSSVATIFALQQIQALRPLRLETSDLAAINKYRLDSFEGPIWITCGTGCCSAD